MTMYRTLICAATVLMLVNTAGCKSNNEQASAPATVKPAVVQPDAQPSASPQVAPRVAIAGKVTETMDAAGYTYVNVETGNGPVWAAIPETKVEVGQEVSLAGGMEMANFESKTLGKTFDSVIFSSGISQPAGSGSLPAETASVTAETASVPVEIASVPVETGGESFADAMQGEASQATVPSTSTSGGSQAAIVQSEDVKVEKAEGENAYTVGEIFEKRKDLDQQRIMVRGKVVKVSLGIMGKNWLHLQDGTGDASAKTHDLVVTTAAQPGKDTIVVVEGLVSADRDFGSGYRYDVIVENAEVK